MFKFEIELQILNNSKIRHIHNIIFIFMQGTICILHFVLTNELHGNVDKLEMSNVYIIKCNAALYCPIEGSIAWDGAGGVNIDGLN